MSDEDVCDHPACELVIKDAEFTREVATTEIAPLEFRAIAGATRIKVVAVCAMCGQTVEIYGVVHD